MLLVGTVVAVTSGQAVVGGQIVPKALPVPQRVAMAGDSVLLTAGYYGGGLRGADADGKIGLGWQAVHAQARVTRDVASPARSPSVLVIAFGQNYGQAFGPAERDQLFTLSFTPHPDACVVLVLPHPGRHWESAHTRNILAVRQTLTTLAAVRPKTVVVDWSPIAQAHPEYIATDGVHLTVPQNPRAATAYLDLIWSGVHKCRRPGPPT